MDKKQYEQIDEKGNSNCWRGGQLDKGSGYWGGKFDQSSVKETTKAIIEKIKEQKEKQSAMKESSNKNGTDR